jgi:hypothetical protein
VTSSRALAPGSGKPRFEASKTQILLARLVIVLLIAFTAVGVFWYGFSEEVRHRVWQQLIERPTGPMAFRFILQPVMAAIATLHDGVNDAKSRRSPYFWTLLTNPFESCHRLYEGLISTARSFCWDCAWTLSISGSCSRHSIPERR